MDIHINKKIAVLMLIALLVGGAIGGAPNADKQKPIVNGTQTTTITPPMQTPVPAQ